MVSLWRIIASLTYDDALVEFAKSYLSDESKLVRLRLNIGLEEYYKRGEERIVKIVGISFNSDNYISHEYIENYEPISKKMYSVMIFDNDLNNLRNSLKQLELHESDPDMEPGIYYNYIVDNEHDLVYVMLWYRFLGTYILIVSLVFVLFTYLLFFNFISVSISYCKKEIGILRALGARTFDVIKIFGYESLIIGFISYLLSIGGWLVVCRILNNSLFGDYYFILNGIITHPFIPIMMLLFVIFISLFVTVTSVTKITKVKPIDAILNK